jgi:hypothetical protein
MVQSTQLPEPLQKSPLLHAVLIALFGLLGVPDVQTLSVQGFASTGRSLSSTALVVPPTPLQRSSRQSPDTCMATGSAVPLLVLEVAQVLLVPRIGSSLRVSLAGSE